MKTFKIASRVVAAWIAAALIFDVVMVYCHFFDQELETKIVKQIDKVIY